MAEVRTGSNDSLNDVSQTGEKPMRADAQRNHEKILEAAEEIFALDGVMVPIDIVAERAGVGIGTLYRHFPTKESLYEAIVLMRLNGVLSIADAYIEDTTADAGVALDAFLREFARQVSEKQDLFEAIGQAGIDIKSRFSGRMDELVERIDVLCTRAIDSGSLRSDVEAQDILTLISGMCYAAGHSGDDDQCVGRLVDIVIAGLQPTSSV
jgi:AcrR family transcriptional regulator